MLNRRKYLNNEIIDITISPLLIFGNYIRNYEPFIGTRDAKPRLYVYAL